MNDIRDASGSNPGDFKVEDGKVYVSVAMPIKVAPDEYETRLRWHIAQWKELRRFRRTTGTIDSCGNGQPL